MHGHCEYENKLNSGKTENEIGRKLKIAITREKTFFFSFQSLIFALPSPEFS